jgi:hypothetical protein
VTHSRRRLETTTSLPRRVVVAIVAVSMLLLALIVTAVLLAFSTADRGDRDSTGAVMEVPGTASPGASPVTDPTGPAPRLATTDDPIVYARSVAEVVFTWSTTSTTVLTDIQRTIVADADPSGVETNGLVADLTHYLPTTAVWQQLTPYSTSQSVRVEKAYVPDSWDDALAQGEGQIAEGTTAVTIEAVRIREGIWLDKPSHAEHDVAFTAFVACPPAFDRCHLLRLSQVDKPLT